MNQRKPLPDELDPKLDELEARMDKAIDDGDGEALAQAAEETWKILPRPVLEWETQGLVGWCTDSLEEIGEWDALRVWIPRYTEQYGADDPSTRILVGILDYNTGKKEAAQRILAGVLDEFGPTVFEGRKEYLDVARRGRPQ